MTTYVKIEHRPKRALDSDGGSDGGFDDHESDGGSDKEVDDDAQLPAPHATTTGTTTTGKRLWGLDMARLLACICVVFSHSSSGLFPGQHAVIVFFVLSGYVLSFSHKDSCVAQLFVSRFIRLLGPTYGVAFAQFLVSWFVPFQSIEYTLHILYDAPKILTLQTGLADFEPFNPVAWTIAYEVYATVLVFITRRLYSVHGSRVFLPIFTVVFVSQYADFAPIVMGVCMAEHDMFHTPHAAFKVAALMAGGVLIIMHTLYGLHDRKHDIILIKHIIAPLFACGALSAFVNFETWCATKNKMIDFYCHRAVCQAARLTFMIYLLHYPWLVVFKRLSGYQLPETIGDFLHGPYALLYWAVFWPVLLVVATAGCVFVDEPCIRLASRYKKAFSVRVPQPQEQRRDCGQAAQRCDHPPNSDGDTACH